ncbi:hypothetical protein F443_11585 [Phytophthora nicotianae P1569]|uniref:Uncharacterized protein n=1 Tax=Phytophthora nicotianae P1569 TaxID=1317065 RepID=V9EX56_PHYNI|nr:hypothetical protein F443_11585 [Phytophthora nicotianae P1569]
MSKGLSTSLYGHSTNERSSFDTSDKDESSEFGNNGKYRFPFATPPQRQSLAIFAGWEAGVVGPSDDSTPPGHYRGQSTARKAPVQKSVIPVVPAKFLAEASSKKQTKKKTKKQPAEETSARRREMVKASSGKNILKNPTNFSALLVVIHRFDSNFATAAGGTKLDTNGEVDEATTEADSEDDSEIDVSYAKSAIPTCYSATFGEVEQLDQSKINGWVVLPDDVEADVVHNPDVDNVATMGLRKISSQHQSCRIRSSTTSCQIFLPTDSNPN